MIDNTKQYAIDASVVLSFLLPDEINQEQARKLFSEYSKGKLRFIAPLLLNCEITNGLKTAIIRKRISLKRGKQLLEQFLKLKIALIGGENFTQVLELAIEYGISAYDAEYVSLAKKEECQLLTADKKLINQIGKRYSSIKLLVDLKI